MTGDDLLTAVRVLIDLDDGDRAEAAAVLLPDLLPVAELLRASDGAQRLARALAARRREAESEEPRPPGHDPHDVRSLYS